VLTRFVIEQADRIDATAEQRSQLLMQATAALRSFLDRLVADVTKAYQQAAHETPPSRARRHATAVEAILAGEPADLAELDYGLDAEHLGVIVAGPGADEAAKRLGAALERPLLSVARDAETTWAWLGGRSVPTHAALERAVRDACPGDGLLLAVGEPARDVEGFRRTHCQAQEALLVARRAATPGVTRYADVALVAHALQDEPFAKLLVELYVAPLDGGRGDTGLCETLRAYFAAERNTRVAADTLGVSRDTIERRLKEIGRRLGPLSANWIELGLALRLHELIR
jgi:hypothetical protein